MSVPIPVPDPLVNVTCQVCRHTLWEGGELDEQGQITGLPFTDGQELLSPFAESSCPIGGTAAGCPNTIVALTNAAEERPNRLRQLIQAIRNRASRGERVPIPVLAANTPAEITVTWPVAMPDTSYSVNATPVHGAALLAAGIRVCIKPGSLTTTGCVLIVASTQAVNAGQAGLHVSAVP